MPKKIDGAAYRLLVVMVGMLCASSALAASYSISADSPDEPAGLCQTVKKALAEGMVLDAERPLCERRFELTPEAERRLGLSSIGKTLVPASGYADLLRKLVPVMGHEGMPQSEAERSGNEIVVSRIMKRRDIKIYAANFDADNSGKIQKAYLLEDASCDMPDSPWDGNFNVFIEKSDGTVDPAWDGSRATGIPFVYKGHTYYVKWTSLHDSVDKNALAQLDIYNSTPFNLAQKNIIPYEVFFPTYCVIYQNK